MKLKGKSGKITSIGCGFPPNFANSGTLRHAVCHLTALDALCHVTSRSLSVRQGGVLDAGGGRSDGGGRWPELGASDPLSTTDDFLWLKVSGLNARAAGETQRAALSRLQTTLLDEYGTCPLPNTRHPVQLWYGACPIHDIPANCGTYWAQSDLNVDTPLKIVCHLALTIWSYCHGCREQIFLNIYNASNSMKLETP